MEQQRRRSITTREPSRQLLYLIALLCSVSYMIGYNVGQTGTLQGKVSLSVSTTTTVTTPSESAVGKSINSNVDVDVAVLDDNDVQDSRNVIQTNDDQNDTNNNNNKEVGLGRDMVFKKSHIAPTSTRSESPVVTAVSTTDGSSKNHTSGKEASKVDKEAKVIMKTVSHGFGVDLMKASGHLLKAVERKAQLHVNWTNGWLYAKGVCPEEDMSCYFEPPIIDYNDPKSVPQNRQEALHKLLTPKPEIRKELDTSMVPVPESCAVIHVRHADVLLNFGWSGNENKTAADAVYKYLELGEYVEAFKKEKTQLKDIVLLTDDQDVIDDVPNYDGKDGLTFHYLRRKRFRGAEGGWENHFPSGSQKGELLTILRTKELVSKCSLWVGTESSFAVILRQFMDEKPTVINLKNRNPRSKKKKAQQQPQPQAQPASSKFSWDDLDLSKTIKCGIDKCFVHSNSLDGNIGYLIGEHLDLYDKLHEGYEYASYLEKTYNVTSMVLGEPVVVQQRPYDLIKNRINPMIYKPPIKGDKTRLFCSAANQKPWPVLHPNRTCEDFPLTIQQVRKAPNDPNTTLFVHTHFMKPEQFQIESRKRLIQLRNNEEFLEKFQISLDQLAALIENEPAFLYDLQFIIDFSTGIIHHIDYDRVLDGRKRLQEGEDKFLKNFGTRARKFLVLMEEMKKFVINKHDEDEK